MYSNVKDKLSYYRDVLRKLRASNTGVPYKSRNNAVRPVRRFRKNTRAKPFGSGMQLQSGFNPSSVGGRKRLGMYRKRRSKNPKRARRRRKFAQKVYAIANNTGQKCDIKSMNALQVGNNLNNAGYWPLTFLTKTALESSYSKTKRIVQDPTTGLSVPETPLLSSTEALKTKYLHGWQYSTLRNNDPSKASCKVQVTWYRCIQNTNSAPTELWTQDMDNRDANGTTSIATLHNPLYNIRQPVPGGLLYKYWRQTKQANYELTGGDSCTIALRRKTPFNHVRLETTTTYIKGVTQIAMIRFMGNIVHDQTDKSQVGYAGVTLDMITQQEDSWCMDKTSDKKHHIYLVDGTSTLGTVVDEEAVVEDNAVMS